MIRLYFCFILLIICFSAHAQHESDEQLAREYSASGDLDKALSVYQKLYNDGSNPEYYDTYFSLLLQTKKFSEAKALTSKMISRDVVSPIYKVDLGRIYQQEGLKERSDSLYKTLLRNLPKDEFRIRELAAAFYRANAYDYAITTFNYGRKVLDDDQAFAFDLLALYRYQKNREMLIDEYIHVISFNPDPSILRQAQNNFTMLLESRQEYATLEDALLKALKKKAPKPMLTQLLSWTLMQQEKFSEALSLLISLDKTSGSGVEIIFHTASTLLDRKEYKAALPAFEYIVSKGTSSDYYLPSVANTLYCRTEELSFENTSEEDIDKLTADYRTLINSADDVNIKAFSIRKLASFNAYQLKRYTEAINLFQEALVLSGLHVNDKSIIKLDLGDIFVLTDNVWEATLLYSQAEKDAEDSLVKQEAQFRNARLSYFRGDFVWAQAQLKNLKAATNQMLANDALNLSLLISENTELNNDTIALKVYAKADMFAFSKSFDKALSLIDSIRSAGIAGSLADDMQMLRARIYLSEQKHLQAIGVLQQVSSQYPSGTWADDALFMMGNIYEKIAEPVKAMACYEKIITDYPGSLYISEARTRFRNLRGDSLG